jgi:hypothetical protein
VNWPRTFGQFSSPFCINSHTHLYGFSTVVWSLLLYLILSLEKNCNNLLQEIVTICHGQTKNLIYETYSPYFTFGNTRDDLNGEFMLSSGKAADEAQSEKISTISETILTDSYDEMEEFNGSLEDFFTVKYQKAMSDPINAGLNVNLTKQMLDLVQRETNNQHGSPTWFNVSARLNALSEATLGKQYLT